MCSRKRIKTTSINAHAFINVWILSASPSSSTTQARRVIYDILRKILVNPTEILVENLPHILTIESMKAIVKEISIYLSSKSGTYRVVYTVEMARIYFCAACSSKKSKSGIATPKQDIDLIKCRLKDVQSLYKELKRKR